MVHWLKQHLIPFVSITTVVVVSLLIFQVLPAGAQEVALEGLQTAGDASGLGQEDIRVIIGNIVRVILGLLGIVGVLLVIYGGFIWMTSQGDPAKIEKAKKILINAGIGLVIVLSALAITQFILNALADATGFGTGSGTDSGIEIVDPFSSALGNGIIDSHFPTRNAQGVARNTAIVVTFREPIDAATIMDGYAGDPTAVLPLNEGSVVIYPTELGDSAALGSTDVNVAVTPDLKSFVFDPVPFLGNATSDTAYTVELTDDIQKEDGDPAFQGAFSDGYTWCFTVSTELDLTPPEVESVIPVASTTNPRNILIQVNYSEPINPISASGTSPAFTNITAEGSSGIISGDWNLVNQYETNEFISDVACGTNSCGETIYCLPANDALTATVTAASLGPEPPTALLPPNGVIDMAGNSLDGNGDGEATGPTTDSYVWSFNTSDEIVLVPPQVLSTTPAITPGVPGQNVGFDQPVSVLFDSLMSLSTVNADNMQLRSPSDALWFTFSSEVTGYPDPINPAVSLSAHNVTVNHGVFSDELLYGVEIDSGIRSIYQNCFTPSRSTSCTGGDANCCNDQSQAGECVYPHYTL